MQGCSEQRALSALCILHAEWTSIRTVSKLHCVPRCGRRCGMGFFFKGATLLLVFWMMPVLGCWCSVGMQVQGSLGGGLAKRALGQRSDQIEGVLWTVETGEVCRVSAGESKRRGSAQRRAGRELGCSCLRDHVTGWGTGCGILSGYEGRTHSCWNVIIGHVFFPRFFGCSITMLIGK